MTDHPDDIPSLEDIDLTSIQGETEHTINVQQNNFIEILFIYCSSFSNKSQNTVPKNPNSFYSPGMILPLPPIL